MKTDNGHLLSASSGDEPRKLHNGSRRIILCYRTDSIVTDTTLNACSFVQRVLNISRSGYSAVFVVTWLVPRETAAVLVHVLRTPYNYAPVYSVTLREATYVWCMCV